MKKIWNWLLIENNRKVLSFIGTGITVIIAGIWTFFTYYYQPETLPKNKEDAWLYAPHSLSPIYINGTWREIYPNPGSISHTVQDGSTFRFTVKGSIQGSDFQSSGKGTIKGKYIESTYQSTIPSTGHCAGTLSSDGIQMTSVCVDSVNGRFESAWVRQ